MGDFVAIKRTQLGPGQKFLPKFLAPYRVIKVMRHDRYVIEKVGDHEGPQQTSTSANNMKLWSPNIQGDSDDKLEQHLKTDVKPGWPNVGSGKYLV